jgi:hypothetical protein
VNRLLLCLAIVLLAVMAAACSEHPDAPSAASGGATPNDGGLDLAPGSYRWQFLPVAGGSFQDFGVDSCH